MLVKETASPRSVIKNNGVGLRVETEDFFCRENGVDEVGGEGRKETVREVWEVRVGGEGNKNIVRVRDSEVRGLRNDINEERVYFFDSNTNTARFVRRSPLAARLRSTKNA